MMISWYSQESRSSTTSSTEGWLERKIASEFPAQSWNCSHTSTGFLVFSSAEATWATYRGGRARVAVIRLQNLRNRRRLTPFFCRAPQKVSFGGIIGSSFLG